jgi:acyl-CoA synthetase (NDP forming)
VSGSIAEQLDPIFKPTSVAVIGASNNPAKWGGRIIASALSSAFRGRIYPINPREREIQGIKAYPDVVAVPGDVDLAVFTVPAGQMPGVMEACVRKGVRGGVIVSADFAETGEKGRALEEETVRLARAGGLRFVGPNGNGIWTSAVGLNISPFPLPAPGPVAFISQSGSFNGIAVRAAAAKGFGLSKFISIGNQADLTAADYLEYLGQDEDTKVMALYMEGFKDGRRFCEVAREVSRKKPILVYKGGRSGPGSRAAVSHTASIAGSDRIFDAMCRQAGLIRVYEVGHLFVMAEALFSQPIPPGGRVAVVANGGQGVAILDYLDSLGVCVPEFRQGDKLRLKEILPPHAPMPTNPVDFAGSSPEAAEEVRVVEALARLDYIDGIVTNVPPERAFGQPSLAAEKQAVLACLDTFCRLPETYGKPIVTQQWQASAMTDEMLKNARIPIFDTPEDCARAMYALVKYAEIRRQGLQDPDHGTAQVQG